MATTNQVRLKHLEKKVAAVDEKINSLDRKTDKIFEILNRHEGERGAVKMIGKGAAWIIATAIAGWAVIKGMKSG